jgi:hypothetical protein
MNLRREPTGVGTRRNWPDNVPWGQSQVLPERPTVAHRGRRNADEALALALASGATLRDAASGAGIGERTATRRWADSAFRQRVTELQHEMVARCMGRLTDGMTEAADVVRKLMSADSESVRLAAARTMLDFGMRGWDRLDLEARVQELEQLAASQPGGDRT